jgi:type I restriction enzyme, S subunit
LVTDMSTEQVTKSDRAAKLREGWQIVRFDQMAESINDRVDDPSEAGVKYYIGLEHLDPESLKIRRWGTPNDVEATKLRFKSGDIIYGRRRAYQRKVGVAEFEGICSAHALVLRVREETVLKEFLPFFMQSDAFFERALSISVGSLSPTINWKTLALQEFALPPKDEQRRIADILWAADEAIESYNLAANAIQTTRDALREEKFANTVLTVRLVDLCEPKGIQIGPFGSQLHASDYMDIGIPVIMPSDMSDDEINEKAIARITPDMAKRLSLHKVLPGDILLPRRGELDKRVFIHAHQTGWVCGTGSIRIRVSRPVIARAVFHALAAPQTVKWIEGHAVGTTMPNLNAQIVSNIPISFPDEQEIEYIVQILEQLNANSSSVLENIKKLNSLKKILLNTILEQKR